MFGNKEFLEYVLSYELGLTGNRQIFPLISVYPSHLSGKVREDDGLNIGRINGAFGFFSSGFDSPHTQNILVLIPEISKEEILDPIIINGKILEGIRNYFPSTTRKFGGPGGIVGFYDVIPESIGVKYKFKIDEDFKSKILLKGDLGKLVKDVLMRENARFNPESRRHLRDISVLFQK